MRKETRRTTTLRVIVAFWACTFTAQGISGETVVERSVETRFQLDLHVPDSVLKTFIPSGWAPNIAVQGPAKDANIRVIFIDRSVVSGPDGKPVGKGSNRLVYLVAPVKNPEGASVQLVIGGLTEDPSDAPGPFGVYLPAQTHQVERSTMVTGDVQSDSQEWKFQASTGEHLEMHIKFVRGPVSRSKSADVSFYSSKDPKIFQISRQEQSLDILRNATTNPPDRVKEFSFKAFGGSYGKLFDGTEKLLSWDHIVWLDRTVILP